MVTSVTDAYSGPFFPNGVTTVFPFDFKAVSRDEVYAFLVDAAGNETALPAGQYSASISDTGQGGSVTIIPALPADGRRLWLASDPSFDQEILFEDEGPFNASILNPGLDRSAVRDIWLRDRVNRSLRLPFGKGGQGELKPIASGQGVVTLSPDGGVAVLPISELSGGASGDFSGGIDGDDAGDSFVGGSDG